MIEEIGLKKPHCARASSLIATTCSHRQEQADSRRKKTTGIGGRPVTRHLYNIDIFI